MKNDIKVSIIDMIGVLLLSFMLIIEYYNNVVFNNMYAIIPSVLNQEINYFLRVSLWKIHLALGVALYIVFIGRYYFNKDDYLSNLLIRISLPLAVIGMISYFIFNEMLHLIHTSFAVFSIIIFLTSVSNNSLKVHYA